MRMHYLTYKKKILGVNLISLSRIRFQNNTLYNFIIIKCL